MATVSKREWTTKSGETLTAWLVTYKDLAGKRRRKQFARKRDAQAFLLKAGAEVTAGIHSPDSTSITVKEAAKVWLRACQVGRGGREAVEAHTLRSYQSHVEHHINPLLGEELVSRLTAPRVGAFRDELLETRSRALAKKVLVSFRSLLNEAVSRGLVAQNVARGITITSAGRHKKHPSVPSKEDVRKIVATAQQLSKTSPRRYRKAWHRYYALVTTAAMTGMRASELRGLCWEQVQFDTRTIAIVQRADERGVIGPVKSSAGRREITLSGELALVLREWKLQCPPGTLVFPNWQGKVENSSNIYNRCWLPLMKKCGLVTVAKTNNQEKQRVRLLYTFHALRHFHASMLIANHATPKEVQSEMGHSTIKVTFDTYGHLFPEDAALRQKRADAMAAEILAP